MRRGVNVAGYFRAEAGVGEAARLLIASLRAAQIPYATVPIGLIPTRQQNPWEDGGSSNASYDTTIVCVNADQLPAFLDRGGWELVDGRYAIAMWWWEVEHFPEWMRPAAAFVDEIWVGSEHTASALRGAVDRPVVVFPPPVVPPRPAPIGRREHGLPEGPFFLFCFDFNSDAQRKNPLGLVRAFRDAFDPGEGPALVLKSANGWQRAEDLEALVAATADRSDIHVVDRHLDSATLHGLMAECDAYVSLHRAEGFGLTIAEAMALGKPAIATGYSGNLEFMTPENSYLVPYELVAIPRGCDPYPAGALWAEPDLDVAARLMREVWERREEAAARGERARVEILERHSPEARAPSLSRRLDEVAALRPRPRPHPTEQRRGAHDPLLDDLWTLHTLPDLHSATAHPASRGKGMAAVARRVVHRLLFPFFHRQSTYNLATMRVLEDVRATLAAQQAEIEQLRARVDGEGGAARDRAD